jgi:hypothetical protein
MIIEIVTYTRSDDVGVLRRDDAGSAPGSKSRAWTSTESQQERS